MHCRWLVAIFAVGMAVGPGCGRRERPVDEGIRSRTLLLGNQNEPATLDPHLINAATDMNVAVALFEGLTCYDERTGNAVPGVAERWEAAPDGLGFTFHLRPNAKWSNGDRVTATDFAYSLQRLLTPALGSGYAYMAWPIKNAEAFNTGKVTDFGQVGVTVVDETTLRLTLERPTPYLPMLAAHSTWMPVHRATVEKAGRADDRASPWTKPGILVGNGAFVLETWQPNARLSVKKNPQYWGAANNRLEGVVFFPTEQPETEERNFRAGQVHLTFTLPPSKIPTYRQESPGQLRLDPQLGVFYVNFNTTKPPLDNPKVRRALSLALDRAAISQSVHAGAWPAAHTLTPPGCGDYVPPTPGQRFDFAAARALLAEAGFPEGRGLPVMPMQVRNDSTMPRMAEAIQAMWQRELGVRITIEPFEQKTWLQNQQSMSHTLGILGWTADYPDPITFFEIFRTGNGNNWTGWGSKACDDLMDQAAVTADPAARLALLQKAEALMLEEAPLAPIVFRASTYLIHPAVKGWEASPLNVHRYQLIQLGN
jgi:oligopeptide transport system substrate-binding protein